MATDRPNSLRLNVDRVCNCILEVCYSSTRGGSMSQSPAHARLLEAASLWFSLVVPMRSASARHSSIVSFHTFADPSVWSVREVQSRTLATSTVKSAGSWLLFAWR